ncbi:polysaccharide biosynthesis C-terminal domain-containing protein [bacterium SCSIO 12741]|nr:polysaccharide biosynthesis C-terminal domain-containing protein [bacterium SCSIO 12741]
MAANKLIGLVFGTAASRFVITLIGLGTLSLNTHFLGADTFGQLSILLVLVAVYTGVSELAGGAALVYLLPRYSLSELALPCYLWTLLILLPGFTIQYILFPLPSDLMLLFGLAVTVQCLNHTHLHLLVGAEKIGSYNLITLTQVSFLAGFLALFYYWLDQASLSTFFMGYLFSQIILLAYSSLMLYRRERFSWPKQSFYGIVQEVFKYGVVVQMANLFQLGAYRANYFILERIFSPAVLGVFSIGNQLSEKALIPANSMAMVQYSKISNAHDSEFARKVSIRFFQWSGLVTLLPILILLLIPSEWIIWIFGPDFGEAQSLFKYLAPGILALGLSTIISHYFAGLGKHYFNTWVSFAGMALNILGSFLIIPHYGMHGAALVVSGVYLVQLIIQLVLFVQHSGASILAFIPNEEELKEGWLALREIMKR